ncbi:MAG: DNA translocase FtsK, partial [Candidatus Izemoplasmataceae bacterium]
KKKKIVPPYKRSADIEPFQLYEIVEEEEAAKKGYQHRHFVSPIFGEHVKDEVVLPIKTKRNQDLNKLDPFRTKPRLTKDERIRKYGTAYPEFDLVRGRNLNEAMGNTKLGRRGANGDEDAPRITEAAIIDHEKDDAVTPLRTEEGRTIEDFRHRPTPRADETVVKREPKPRQESAESESSSVAALRRAATKSTPSKPESASQDKSPEDEPLETPHESEAEHRTFQEEPKTDATGPAPDSSDDEDHEPSVKQEKDASNKTVTKGSKTYDAYQIPPVSLLSEPESDAPDLSESIERQTNIINETFAEFGVGARVYDKTQGPSVTRYEIAVERGVKLNKITNLYDNLKMALAAKRIRIEAPIPGKRTVGIEVPNEKPRTVHFIEITNRSMFKNASMPLTIALGLDIDGNPIYAPIRSMPHGLIAGQTGSGKSVCINTVLMSLLLKNKPNDLKLMLIDPKMVELSHYNDLPHLITPVITDAKAATAGLKWVVEEMERRFKSFSTVQARDIDAYNGKMENESDKLPYIVIVVDELADLMMVASQHVEESIMRITQKARACGIHLLVATQRPSTDVVKGTIKSNIPTRIAFSVSSHIDSQTILDSSGAETLLGRGDMLFHQSGQSKVRLQGAFVSDTDIETITGFIKNQAEPNYLFKEDALLKNANKQFEYDELLEDVAHFVVQKQEASINKISKEFSIGFNRAQSIVESLEAAGIVSGNLGSKARTVLITEDEIGTYLDNLG